VLPFASATGSLQFSEVSGTAPPEQLYPADPLSHVVMEESAPHEPPPVSQQ
jgi:hypothetical protein